MTCSLSGCLRVRVNKPTFFNIHLKLILTFFIVELGKNRNLGKLDRKKTLRQQH